MSETAYPVNAADLLVYGTFVLRRALHELSYPIRHAAPPASAPEPHEAQREEERPTVGVSLGRS